MLEMTKLNVFNPITFNKNVSALTSTYTGKKKKKPSSRHRKRPRRCINTHIHHKKATYPKEESTKLKMMKGSQGKQEKMSFQQNEEPKLN